MRRRGRELRNWVGNSTQGTLGNYFQVHVPVSLDHHRPLGNNAAARSAQNPRSFFEYRLFTQLGSFYSNF